MTHFVLASAPLVELTLRSYEMLMAALMISNTIERDASVRESTRKQIEELEHLIEGARNVLKNIDHVPVRNSGE